MNWLKKIFTIDPSDTKSVNILMWILGPIGYLVSYFIINKLIAITKIIAINAVLVIAVIIYFSWHIYQLRKCSIKKREALKDQPTPITLPPHSMSRSFLRKLFLQEPITKSNPILIAILIDLYFIVNTINYFLTSLNYL